MPEKPSVVDAVAKSLQRSFLGEQGNDYARMAKQYENFGTGKWRGEDWFTTLAGNGYTQSMLPSTIAGAGVGALLNAIRGKSILSGMGLGAATGAGLGALHQYLYDTNRDYAFKNPFTKFMEWMTVPKDKNGMVYVYDMIRDKFPQLLQNSPDGSPNPIQQWLESDGDKLNFNYNDVRDYIAKGQDKDVLRTLYNTTGVYKASPLTFTHPFKSLGNAATRGYIYWKMPKMDANNLRPHHLYYPSAIISNVLKQMESQQAQDDD